ncbi:MAG: MBL fold metallo-hydrolase [Clostridia bacterium]|nr:MBL fold metallo-hydrolase [Clostridia bacterium]
MDRAFDITKHAGDIVCGADTALPQATAPGMRVTYLGHSGFLAETAHARLLFDYIRGTLPETGDGKPLFVFASHFHADHFCPAIFDAPLAAHVTRYVLSSDIRKKRGRVLKALPEETRAKIVFVKPDETLDLGACRIATLGSTDEGVAFTAEADGLRLYHAGDLNNWYWAEEDPAWNADMARRYTAELKKIAGQSFDAAFVPVDPRLGDAYGLGLREFLSTVRAKHVFPMHFWKKPQVIARYKKEHAVPEGTAIHDITKEDETHEL